MVSINNEGTFFQGNLRDVILVTIELTTFFLYGLETSCFTFKHFREWSKNVGTLPASIKVQKGKHVTDEIWT